MKQEHSKHSHKGVNTVWREVHFLFIFMHLYIEELLFFYVLEINNSSSMNVLGVNCLRCLVEVSRMDRDWNEEVHRRAGIEKELASRVDRRVLRWFGLMNRMDE